MITCYTVVGLLFLVSHDINGDRYLINIDEIVHVIEDSEGFAGGPITRITTQNGTVVEDESIIAVADAMASCESIYYD